MTQISTDDRHAFSEDFSLNCQSKKSLRVFSSWLLFVLILQQLQWKPRGFSLSFHEKTINDHQSILRGIFCCFFALSEIVCRNEGKAVLIKRNEESKQTWNQSTMTLLLESRMLLSPFLSLLSSCAAKTSLSRRRDTLFHVSTEIREMVTDSSNEREWKSNRVCFFHAIHFKRDARQRLSSMSLFLWNHGRVSSLKPWSGEWEEGWKKLLVWDTDCKECVHFIRRKKVSKQSPSTEFSTQCNTLLKLSQDHHPNTKSTLES